jgi:uncharacterized protein (TIGR02444 family)
MYDTDTSQKTRTCTTIGDEARAQFCTHAFRDIVAVYGVEGIAPLCLKLQGSHDADVPVLMFFALADRAGQGMPQEQLPALIARIGEWRSLAVLPLRALRIALKGACGTADEAGFRETVKAAELEAERLEVERLATDFLRVGGASGYTGGMAAFYLSELGLNGEETQAFVTQFNAAIDTIRHKAATC